MADTVDCRPPSFQLELMRHDPVMRESFQKLSDWICRNLPNSLDQLRTIISVEDAPSATIIKNCLCDSSVYVGAALRVVSGICYNAKADTVANSRVIGICISKSDATHCDIVMSGQSGEIFPSLNIAQDYFLSPTVDGALQTSPPSGAGHVVAFIGRPLSTKILVVNVALRMQRAL